MSEETPKDWYYITQGGGKAAYDELGQLYFRQAPEWAPEMLGGLVPDDWGFCGPFHTKDGHLIEEKDYAVDWSK